MSKIVFDTNQEDKDNITNLFAEKGLGSVSNGMRQLVSVVIEHPEILTLMPDDHITVTDQKADSRFDQLEDLLDEKFEQLNNKFSGDKQSVDITHQLITELQGDVHDLSDEVKNDKHSSLDQVSIDRLSDTLTRNLKVLLFDMMMSGQQPAAPGRYVSNRTDDISGE